MRNGGERITYMPTHYENPALAVPLPLVRGSLLRENRRGRPAEFYTNTRAISTEVWPASLENSHTQRRPFFHGHISHPAALLQQTDMLFIVSASEELPDEDLLDAEATSPSVRVLGFIEVGFLAILISI